MLRKSLFSVLSLGLIVLASSNVNAQHAIVPAIAYPSAENYQGYSIGFDFVAKAPVSVTQLGVYDTNFLVVGETITIVDLTHAATATATVTTTGTVGSFSYFNLDGGPITLTTGDTYSVYTTLSAGQQATITSATQGLTSNFGASNIGGSSYFTGYSTNGGQPTIGQGLVGTDLTYAAIVPEPASVTMLGLGLVGVAFAARRKMAK